MLETLAYIAAIIAAIFTILQYYGTNPSGGAFREERRQDSSDSSGSFGNTTIQGSTIGGGVSVHNNFTGVGPTRHVVIDRLRQAVQVQDFVTDGLFKAVGLLSLVIAWYAGSVGEGFQTGFIAWLITAMILYALVVTPIRILLRWRLSRLIELQHLTASEIEFFINWLAERTWKDKTSLKDVRKVIFDK